MNKPQNNSPSVTYITKDTEINADIYCKDDIRIAGTVEGEVVSKQKLILNDSGKINGSIISPVADISGKITGDVRVTNKLTLRSTAVIKGEIFTKKLAIEDGAQLSGALQVGPDINVNGNGKEAKQTTSSSSSSFFKKNKNKPEEKEADDSENASKSEKDSSDSSSETSKLSA